MLHDIFSVLKRRKSTNSVGRAHSYMHTKALACLLCYRPKTNLFSSLSEHNPAFHISRSSL